MKDSRHSVRAFLEQNRFLLAFALLASMMGVSVGMAQVTTSLYAVELHTSAALLGLISAAQSVGVIFMSLPVGVLTDRLGPSRPFVFGTGLVGLLYAATPLVHAPAYLLLCTALISFFMPFRFVSLNTLFLQQLASLGEAKAGWYRATHMIGMYLIGPALGAQLVAKLGAAHAYYVIALAFGVTILISPVVFARYSPPRSSASASASAPRQLRWEALRSQLELLGRDAELRRVSLIEGATQATSSFFAFFIPILGVSAGMSEAAASSLISAKGISYILALFFLGSIVERLAAARGYAASFGIIALGLALIGTRAVSSLFWGGSLILGLGVGATQIGTLTRYAQIGGRTGYGRVSGLNALVGPAGGVLGGLIGGAIGHWLGFECVFWIAAAGFLLAGASFLLEARAVIPAKPA